MNPYIQYMYSYPHKTAYRPMSGVNLGDFAHRLKGPGHGLYLHVPFCQRKCGYCNLFSVTGAKEEEIERYLDAIERQVRQYRQILSPWKTRFSSFTVGGGTPLCLTTGQLDRMFSMVSPQMEKKAEMVIETAPNQTEREKLRVLKEAGVTRVSMGIQSFNQEELRTLRRGHSPMRAREALELLMSFDFDCVNLDFIYGIPGQGIQSLLNSLREAVGFGPREIFLYPLYVKHGAGLEREGVAPDPQKAYRQYEEASLFLRSQGFCQDSMRRFVRGRQGQRGFSDCGFSTSLALGCGGRSYVGDLHFCAPYAVTAGECARQLRAFEETKDFTEITHGIRLSPEEEKRRFAIRHVLIRPGVEEEGYWQRFGSRVLEDFPVIARWMEEGLAFRDEGGFIALTDRGMGLSDFLGPQLISDEVLRAMGHWEEEHGLKGAAYDSLQRQPEKL